MALPIRERYGDANTRKAHLRQKFAGKTQAGHNLVQKPRRH